MATANGSFCGATNVSLSNGGSEMVYFFANSTSQLNWAQLVGSVPTIAAQYCACDDAAECYGICPNPDLAGIGVRVAFYFQSIANAWLIIKSPEDAAQGAWASTVLTSALTIPALIQKFQGALSLHHATLVLNFATLSTISSLAVAPMVPIWREGVKTQHMALPTHSPQPGGSPAHLQSPGPTAKDVARTRGRMVLSFALLAQIILQWSWAILLFTSPKYSGACSAETSIVWIGGVMKAEVFNESFVYWALWLLFCMMMTLTYGVIMVATCPSDVHDAHRFQPKQSPRIRRRRTLREKTQRILPNWVFEPSRLLPKDDQVKMWTFIRSTQLFAILLSCFFVGISEAQMRLNDTLDGEQNLWSFSQTAAILLALAPAWALAVATFSPDTRLPGHQPGSPTWQVTEAFQWPLPPEASGTARPSPVPSRRRFIHHQQGSSNLSLPSTPLQPVDTIAPDPGFPFYTPAGIARYPAPTSTPPSIPSTPPRSRFRALSLRQRQPSSEGSSTPNTFYVRLPYISSNNNNSPPNGGGPSESYEMDETRQPLMDQPPYANKADDEESDNDDITPIQTPIPTMPVPDPYNKNADIDRSPQPPAPGLPLPSVP